MHSFHNNNINSIKSWNSRRLQGRTKEKTSSLSSGCAYVVYVIRLDIRKQGSEVRRKGRWGRCEHINQILTSKNAINQLKKFMHVCWFILILFDGKRRGSVVKFFPFAILYIGVYESASVIQFYYLEPTEMQLQLHNLEWILKSDLWKVTSNKRNIAG